jgi:hypothetical protein
MKKAVYGAVFVLSSLQILFINFSVYMDLPPSLRVFQYRLWGFHTPWVFFTSHVLQKEKPLFIYSKCLLQTCRQPGDFRFKALMIQNAIESEMKVHLIEKNLCQLTSDQKILYRYNQEEKIVVCSR